MEKKWVDSVKLFFSNWRWRKIGTFLFFFILAFAFWMMMFFRKRNVESIYRMPIKYINVPENIVFDRKLPESIEIKLQDYGSQIFRYDTMRKDSLVIDVEDFMKNDISTIQGNQLIHLISQNLSTTSNLLTYYPSFISLRSSKLEQKEVPIEFVGKISTASGNYIVDTTRFMPQKVKAYSSIKKLQNISSAKTENISITNLKSTSVIRIKLNSNNGIKYVPNEVDYYISVKEFTEKEFDVPVHSKNLPESLNVKFFPSQVKVSFLVTLEEYKKISPEDFKIELDYQKFKENKNGKVELQLTSYPSSVKNPRLLQNSVEFLFETR